MTGRPRRAGQLINRGPRRWLIRVYLGRDPNTGKRRYLNETVRGNKKDAQARLNELLRDRDMGRLVEPSRQSLRQYLERWLEIAASRVSDRTALTYRDVVNLYILPSLGSRRLDQVSPVEVQEAWNRLQAEGKAPSTIHKAHSVLRNALNQAVRWRLIPFNPIDHVDVPRQEHKEHRPLSPEEAERFLDAAKEGRHHALFALLVTTGLRPGEALALRWEDLDLRAGTLTVQRAVTGPDGNRRIVPPKTPQSRRTVPIPKSVVQLLREHKRVQAAERLAAPIGTEYRDEGLVFAERHGGLLHYRNLVRRHFKPTLERAGLPSTIRLYDLRHTCATLLLVAGENPKVVSERLGHANITMTLSTYSHVLPSMQQAATEKLEAMIFGGGGK